MNRTKEFEDLRSSILEGLAYYGDSISDLKLLNEFEDKLRKELIEEFEKIILYLKMHNILCQDTKNKKDTCEYCMEFYKMLNKLKDKKKNDN